MDDCPLNARDGGFIRAGYHAGTRQAARTRHRGQAMDRRATRPKRVERTGIAGDEGRLQQGLRLLPRDHARKHGEGFRPTTFASRRSRTPSGTSRRELEESRRRVLTARGAFQGAGVRPVRRAARAGRRRGAAHSGDGRSAGGDRRARGSGGAGPLAELACGPTILAEPVLDIDRRDGTRCSTRSAAAGTFVPNDTLLPGRVRVRSRKRTRMLQSASTGIPHLCSSSPARTWPARAPTFARWRCITLDGAGRQLCAGEGATIGIADRIFARVGASDELSRAATARSWSR